MTRPNRDLRIMACVFCKEPLFQRWVKLQPDIHRLAYIGVQVPPSDEQLAKGYILAKCGVASRNDLDTDPAAAELFHQHIRRPFLEWRDANKE